MREAAVREAGGVVPAAAAVRAAEDAHFRWPLRVYYEDTDAAGVVYYANYLRFLERARTEWLMSLGHFPERLAADGLAAFVVRRVRVDYRMPARLGEQVEVTLSVRTLHRASLALAQQVRRERRVLVDAEVELACVDPRSWRPVRIPAVLMQTLEALH